MATQQTTPAVKLETSPAESVLSAPGDNYQSLFPSATPSDSTPATMNPMEMMTPKSYSDRQDSPMSTIQEDEEDGSQSSDKKPTKKRKSWGQVLPEPKTNLPPRKRAKTDDEKEQRRVERVLRNRRAAQSSRERKRLEVEALEQRNKELEDLLVKAQKTNLLLAEELNRFRRDSGVVTRTPSVLDTLQDNMTLSPELFTAQSALNKDQQSALMPNPTVNPASLSPALAPVPDSQKQETSESSEQNKATSADVTQHPAAMLSNDLPCHMSAEVPKSFLNSQMSLHPALTWTLQLQTWILSASVILSACQRPLTQIAMSSKAGFSLLPTPRLLTTIIWLVTLPRASRTKPTLSSSTSTTSSTTRQTTSPLTLWQRATMPLRTTASTTRSSTLRLKSLRKILSSSPLLARPLMDATLVALRLVSEGREDRVENLCRESSGTREQDRELTECLSGIVLPSREVLMTLLWALKVEDQRIQKGSGAVLAPVSGSPSEQQQPTNIRYILKVSGRKQRLRQQQQLLKHNMGAGRQRYRLRRDN